MLPLSATSPTTVGPAAKRSVSIWSPSDRPSRDVTVRTPTYRWPAGSIAASRVTLGGGELWTSGTKQLLPPGVPRAETYLTADASLDIATTKEKVSHLLATKALDRIGRTPLPPAHDVAPPFP